jgi:[ribulose-bisphosphate carboxylase]-lysine N-methyltransferase
MATSVVLGEKEALDATMGWFEARLGQLKRLEYYQERRLKRLKLIDDEGRTTYTSFFEDGIA